ncbi:MAG: tetratricopeptide repeat protein [Planctomycetes bacterium]|nr:tetratricopeptide repeat protein [Planctomycetota bacterium]
MARHRDMAVFLLITAVCAGSVIAGADTLDQSEAALKARIARPVDATDSDAIASWYLDRITLAAFGGLARGAGPGQRVRFDLADRADRRTLATLTTESLGSLEALAAELDARIDRAARDPDEVIVGLPDKLARMRDAAAYRRGWVRLYLALVLDDAPEAASAPAEARAARRQRMLLDAAEDAGVYADASDDALRRGAQLLRGIALARAGRVEAAEAALAPLAEAPTTGEVRVSAAFELARLAVDARRWDVAFQRSEAFVKQCEPRVAPERAIVVRLYGAVLADRLGRCRAEAAADPGEKAAWIARADGALAQLLLDHPDQLPALAASLARPWRDRDDLDALPTAVLVARGVADEPGTAVACLMRVIERSDRVSRAFAPECLWRLAAALYRRGEAAGEDGWNDCSEAARRFEQLAREHSGDERAADAAANAARILDRRIGALEAQGLPVQPALRRRCAAVLELIATRWPQRDEAMGFTLALARQHERLGDGDSALAWYARVGETSRHYLQARYGELALRSDRLADGAAAGPQQRAEAESLLAAWTDLVKRAQEQANAPLAAAADFHVARLLADPLGRTEQALGHCQTVVQRWKDHEQVVTAAEALRIELLLAGGRLEAAVAALDRLAATAGDQAGQRQVVLVTLEIRRRLDAALAGPDPAAAAAALNEPYLRLAERACRTVADGDEAVRYPLEQMRAEALVQNGRIEEAEGVFGRLAAARPDDARNLEGLAQCRWRAGRHAEAVAMYEQVLAGLDPARHADLWWRVQLALVRCAYDAAGGDAERLGRLEIRLAQLEAQDQTFGGYRARFEQLRSAFRNK